MSCTPPRPVVTAEIAEGPGAATSEPALQPPRLIVNYSPNAQSQPSHGDWVLPSATAYSPDQSPIAADRPPEYHHQYQHHQQQLQYRSPQHHRHHHHHGDHEPRHHRDVNSGSGTGRHDVHPPPPARLPSIHLLHPPAAAAPPAITIPSPHGSFAYGPPHAHSLHRQQQQYDSALLGPGWSARSAYQSPPGSTVSVGSAPPSASLSPLPMEHNPSSTLSSAATAAAAAAAAGVASGGRSPSYYGGDRTSSMSMSMARSPSYGPRQPSPGAYFPPPSAAAGSGMMLHPDMAAKGMPRSGHRSISPFGGSMGDMHHHHHHGPSPTRSSYEQALSPGAPPPHPYSNYPPATAVVARGGIYSGAPAPDGRPYDPPVHYHHHEVKPAAMHPNAGPHARPRPPVDESASAPPPPKRARIDPIAAASSQGSGRGRAAAAALPSATASAAQTRPAAPLPFAVASSRPNAIGVGSAKPGRRTKERRESHIRAEQKRRGNINAGYDALRAALRTDAPQAAALHLAARRIADLEALLVQIRDASQCGAAAHGAGDPWCVSVAGLAGIPAQGDDGYAAIAAGGGGGGGDGRNEDGSENGSGGSYSGPEEEDRG
ncbi:hypothetical protein BC828DRAFT_375237 [Blastocladiella britannica]|nr:hypothetical protein BC828DRAFT_375237 [Blastocladiella britannica]